MHYSRCLVRASLLIATTSLVPTTGRAQQAPTASTTVRIPADSLFSTVRGRLKARGYHLDETDAIRHRFVVRGPNDETRVEVRIAAVGDSSTITIGPLDAEGTRAPRALIMVTHDATLGLETEGSEPAAASGELPESHWRPELFVSPGGKFWMARGGLYRADSLRGGWRRVLGNQGDSIDPDDLRIGIAMALVDDSTALLGLPDRPGVEGPQLYRTTDGGVTWSPVPAADLAWVDDMAALGASVWLLGTKWENNKRRGLFLRSTDAGATWERTALPPQLNDITHLYRVSQSTAYVATAGFNRGPVFWITTDSGNSWKPIATPHDKGLHKVPSYGVRVEQIATVGDWLVVREYGLVFVSRADSIKWRRLDGIEHVAADLEHVQLFVLTDSLHAAMLDRNLNVLWRTPDRIPDAEPTNVEKVLIRAGTGYVSMSYGEVYEARDGILHLVQPKAHPQ